MYLLCSWPACCGAGSVFKIMVLLGKERGLMGGAGERPHSLLTPMASVSFPLSLSARGVCSQVVLAIKRFV